jgi:hypothetical protein
VSDAVAAKAARLAPLVTRDGDTFLVPSSTGEQYRVTPLHVRVFYAHSSDVLAPARSRAGLSARSDFNLRPVCGVLREVGTWLETTSTASTL